MLIIANDLAKMQIEASVSEADVGGVEEGQAVEFTVDAFPLRKFQGKVQQVRFAPTTNQGVISYTTVVAVDNRVLELRPGMTANSRFITAERRGVLRIPNTALRFRPGPGAPVRGDTNAPAGGAAGCGRARGRAHRERSLRGPSGDALADRRRTAPTHRRSCAAYCTT